MDYHTVCQCVYHSGLPAPTSNKFVPYTGGFLGILNRKLPLKKGEVVAGYIMAE